MAKIGPSQQQIKLRKRRKQKIGTKYRKQRTSGEIKKMAKHQEIEKIEKADNRKQRSAAEKIFTYIETLVKQRQN